jgi:hypothetical protein
MQAMIRGNGRQPMRVRPQLRGFGAVTSAQESQVAGAAASAGASALATGTAVGSAAGPIGAAAGAIVGVVVGILTKTNNTASHIGTWDSQLIGQINQLPSSVWGIGRQFPYNENSHGLVQMIEAALACGVYMSWDSSLISNYDVCANWAVTFGTAVQNVARTAFLNPPGIVSVSIPLSPGAGGYPPFTFGFQNPNIIGTNPAGQQLSAIGPDALSASLIMGKSGLMEAMMTALGGQQAGNIASNGVNPTAQKIFALMIDYWWAQYLPSYIPQGAPGAPSIASTIATASSAANTAASNGTNPQTAATVAATVATAPVAPQPPPVIATTTTTSPSTGATVATPVVAPSDTGALVTSLVASGTEPSDAIAAGNASLEANGIDSTAPASQAQLQSDVTPSTGLSTTDWLLIGGGVLGAIGLGYVLTRGK